MNLLQNTRKSHSQRSEIRNIEGMRTPLFFILYLVFLSASALHAQQTIYRSTDIPVFNIENNPLAMPWAGGINTPQIGNIDADGDGEMEVIMYDRSSQNYQLFDMVDGTITSRPYSHMLPETIAGWTLFRDYNCDGKVDMFTTGELGVEVYKNVGDDTPEWELVEDNLSTLGSSGMINLVINSSDVPAINDVDGDGDLDVLVYNFALGGYIRYHQNMSMEKYGNCDSLDFEFVDREWGAFEECNCNSYAFYDESCSDFTSGRVQHAGGKTLLALDVDNDGDVDLFGGQEDCTELYFFENIGTADSAFFGSFRTDYPVSQNPVDIHYLPAAFYADVTFDGISDLVVASDMETNDSYTQNYASSLWLYSNIGTNTEPQFEFSNSAFWQDDMLDFGENSVPLFMDIDEDMDQDLIVAANGFKKDSLYVGYLTLLENTGNYFSPSFTVAQKDFLNISSLSLVQVKANLVNGALWVSGYNQSLDEVETYVYIKDENTGEWNSDYSDTFVIPLVANDTPEFYDVDDDGDQDLIIGKSDGSLQYYSNDGEQNFTLEDNTYLGIERDFSGTVQKLVARVVNWDHNGTDDLLLTDQSGAMYVVLDFSHKEEQTVIDLLSEDEPATRMLDMHSWPAMGQLFGSESAIVVGGSRGGLQYLTFENSEDQNEKASLLVYPNPVRSAGILNLLANDDMKVIVYSVDGKQVTSKMKLTANVELQLDLSTLSDGIYILKSEDSKGNTKSQRILVWE